MIRACLSHGFAVTMMLTVPLSASANDLVDFLKAVQEVSHYARHASRSPVAPRGQVYGNQIHRGHGHDRGLSSRDIYKHRLSHVEAYSRQGFNLPYESQLRLHEPNLRGVYPAGSHIYRNRAGVYQGRSGRVTVGYHPQGYQEAAPVPGTPVPPAPAPGSAVLGTPYQPTPILSAPSFRQPNVIPPVQMVHATHQIGEIIDCPVPLATCIRIKDPDHIAPDAIPTVVAVRDPNLCRHKCDCCVERVVYIEVCLPPCPPRKLRISPDGTYVCMNYGKYQVELTSRKGLITIDYDD